MATGVYYTYEQARECANKSIEMFNREIRDMKQSNNPEPFRSFAAHLNYTRAEGFRRALACFGILSRDDSKEFKANIDRASKQFTDIALIGKKQEDTQ